MAGTRRTSCCLALAAVSVLAAGCGSSGHSASPPTPEPLVTGAARTALAQQFTAIFAPVTAAGTTAAGKISAFTSAPSAKQYAAILVPYGRVIQAADTQLLALHAPGKDGVDIQHLVDADNQLVADFNMVADQDPSQILTEFGDDDVPVEQYLDLVRADLGLPPVKATS